VIKQSKILLLALCTTSAIFASKDEQKTILVLRDQQHRAANFSAFHELKPQKSKSFGSKFQNTFFYHETHNSTALGRLFGTKNSNKIIVGTASQVASGTAYVENNLLLHYHGSPNSLEGIISFNPQRTVQGTMVETVIKLDKILKGLYLKKKLIIMEVEHDLNAVVCTKEPGATDTEAQLLSDILNGKSIKRRLGGGVNDRFSEQELLCYAKIGCFDETRTGIENLESIIGWNFFQNDDYHVGINFAFQSPTGDQTTAEYLWEPRVGSLHWAVGGGVKAGATAWKCNKQNLKCFFEFNYRYHLEAKEKRTLGIKNILEESCDAHLFSPYYQIAEIGKYMLIPAANILTKDVDVTPKHEVDTFITINYNIHKFSFDLGYNFYHNSKESVELNRCNWRNDTYGIAAFSWTTCDNEFTLADMQPAGMPINYENIDTSIAESPSILSHSIFGSVAYIANAWGYPFMVSLGGAYEQGDDYRSADSFTVWAKTGLSF